MISPLSSRSAAIHDGGPSHYQNFLIIVPEAGGDSQSDEQVKVLARHFNKSGFAYVARTGEKEMADDAAGVRYLPLGMRLPSFGLMPTVIVIKDPAWALRAVTAYPGADVFLLEPSTPAASRRSHAASAQLPQCGLAEIVSANG